MRIRDEIARLREDILSAAAERGARNVRLFGSVARGDDQPDSDIDFLVALDANRTLLDLAELEILLEKLLGRSVDIVTERSVRDPVRLDIVRDAVSV